MEKALKALEDSSGNNVNCQALLEKTFQTFSLLERWETAESNISSVQSIIERVQEQGHAYFRTLDDSISVAIHLNVLAHDVVQLAKFLIKAREPKEIQDFIADMKSNTRDALESSKRISTAYRKVRRGINEISDGIPGEMARLERRENRIVAKKEALDRRIERAKVMKTIGTTALAVVSGVAIVYDNRSSKTLRKREDEITDCQTGLKELHSITLCLASLAENVDLLIDFWLRSDTMLETISHGVDRLRDNRARLRLEAIVEQWTSAGEFYTDYTTKLKRIQDIDCGATSSLKSRSSSSASDRSRSRSRDQKKITPSTEFGRRNATKQPNQPFSTSRHSK
ncbi:hypothetical protein DFH08DRAFT_88271 [Mycena albidolilacea]|uniref:Uncharacterized protein n=1 Tax=Mycena albidolilacea TaxID=1033008 RepID=A0AAD7A993_9AGAR|nr:hypothetical protein DFH08DRAFT_88271 [Mycena albidolilacea]